MSEKLKTLNAREVAFFILGDYFSKKSNLKVIISKRLSDNYLSPVDRKFVYELVKGTVRFYMKIDYLISLFSSRPLKKINIRLLNILRLSIYQLMSMTRVPSYSIVDQGVEIAKKYSGIAPSGFVNAVLRKVCAITDIESYLADSIKENFHSDKERLKIKYSFPDWIVEYWIKSYGPKKTEAIFKQLNKNPKNFIRVNKTKTDKHMLIDLFRNNGFREGVDYGPDIDLENIQHDIFEDVIIIRSSQDIEMLPGFNEGYFSVQDFSSQLAVKYYLEPLPGEKILDICGAPGGKATFIAELTGAECEVTSVDINENKIEYFKKNIERLGLKNIEILKADVSYENFLQEEDIYDKIFVDLPCSALGTISKNPDVKYNKSPEDIKRLSGQSTTILNNCTKYLKKNGRMVVYTCTLSTEENQKVIEEYVQKNPGLFIVEKSIPSIFLNYLDDKNIETDPADNIRSYEILPYYFKSEGGCVSIIEKRS